MTTIAANPTVLKAVSASIGKDIPPFTAGKDKEADRLMGVVRAIEGGDANAIKQLNQELLGGSFVTGTSLSALDLAALSAVHGHLAKLGKAQRAELVNVCRWADHVQHFAATGLGLAKIEFDLDIPYTAPPEPVAGKKEKEAAAPAAAAAAASAPAASATPAAAPAAKGDKKEKGKAAPAPAAAAAPAEEGPLIGKLDIRVGVIKKAWRHPDAESLYVEEIDVGEAAPRQVVSGLVKFIPEPQMQGQRCLVLCNLKPAAMRGITSHAMVLCASDAEHTKVEFVVPPAACAPGERIVFAGCEAVQPEEQLNPKKKVWETVQPDLKTTAEKVPVWKDLPFSTKHGLCTVATIANGNIK